MEILSGDKVVVAYEETVKAIPLGSVYYIFQNTFRYYS